MVVRITINVKHIRGDSFQIDADNEADSLGLKVLIWEQHQIPVENQRLVFAGRELQDGVKLSACGINDGATIFLVESSPQAASQLASVPAAVIPPAYAPIQQEKYQPPVVAVQVPMNVNGYAPVDSESMSQEKISVIIDLAWWVRFYCIIAMIFCSVLTFSCTILFLIPFLMYLIGWAGTRKLNRCCLVFPVLVCAAIGFGGFICSIAHMANDFEYWNLLEFFIAILHICIFACICKLICFIKRSSVEEIAEARRRIATRGCCC